MGHTPFDERVGCLLRAAKDMLRAGREAMAVVEEEMGKVHAEALFTEALGPLDAVKGWAAVLRPALARAGCRSIRWAFPGKRALVEAVPARSGGDDRSLELSGRGAYRRSSRRCCRGNAIVLKPSEHSPRSSGWLAAPSAAHLPAGVVGRVQGTARWARPC